MKTILKLVTTILFASVLVGCAGLRERLPEAHVQFDPAPNERVGNTNPLLVQSEDTDIACSATVPLPKEMRLTLDGFFAKHLEEGERKFIPPGKFIRVLAAGDDGKILLGRGIVDDTLSAVFVNLPKDWCQPATQVQAVIISNAGTSVAAGLKIFGPLYRLVYGSNALDPTIDVGLLVKDRAYLQNFLKENPALAKKIPGPAILTEQEITALDKVAPLAGMEMMEETKGAKFLGNTKFFFDFTDFLMPYNAAGKVGFLAFNTYNALNVPPHGFTELSCHSTERLLRNVQYIRERAIVWAQEEGIDPNRFRFRGDLNDMLRQDSDACVDPFVAATFLDVAVKDVIHNMHSVVK